MVKSSLCDYCHAYILVIGTITINGAVADNVAKRLELKKYFCTIYWLHKQKKNNTQTDNAKDLDVVMSIYNLIEYGKNYSKTLGIL